MRNVLSCSSLPFAMVESSECDSFLARNCKAIFLRRLSFHAVSKLILYTDWDSSHTFTKGNYFNYR